MGVMNFVGEPDVTKQEDREALAKLMQAVYSMVKGIKSFEVIEEEIAEDGMTAIVKTNIVYGDGDTKNGDKTKLIKTDDGWKIVIEA